MGRVDVKFYGMWGTVCDDIVQIANVDDPTQGAAVANLVCKQVSPSLPYGCHISQGNGITGNSSLPIVIAATWSGSKRAVCMFQSNFDFLESFHFSAFLLW